MSLSNFPRKSRLAFATGVAAGVMGVVAAVPAAAQTTVKFGTNNTTTSAQAVFTFLNGTNGYLDITLKNTAAAAAASTNDVLTGLFFTLSFSPSGTALSTAASWAANTSAGLLNAAACTASCSSAVNIGYQDSLYYSPTGYAGTVFNNTNPQYGLAASQISVGGTAMPANHLSGTQLDSNSLVNSVAFGIVGSGGAGSLSAAYPYVNRSVDYKYTGDFSGQTLTVSNVWFVYGYAPTTAINGQIPEPSSLLLLGSGLLGYPFIRRRRKPKGAGT